MVGKIVFEGKSKKGRNFLIRYIQDGDAKAMCDYMNVISQERTFISYQGEELVPEEEKKYVERKIEAVEEGRSVELLAFFGEKLIGIVNLDLGVRTSQHIAGLGISIARGFRDEGIGSKFFETVISEGKKNLKGLEIVKLSVFAKNEKAKQIYEKFGFSEYGRLPDGVKLEKGHDDHILMYKRV
ncbi:MAG: GNAT family N-acetyltransferase [bacterium]|nr:GNAT family N-acetyltransferase [bacterium]